MPDAILAIETSTARGSVAVLGGGQVRLEKSFASERSHNSQLFIPLRQALEACASDLRAIVVGTGPASYTGVRIAIAAAQGVALSRGVPVIGLPSVLAVGREDLQAHSKALPACDPEAHLKTCATSARAYRVCGDARRGSFFLADVRDNRLAGDLAMLDAEGLRQRHRELCLEAPWFTFDAKPPLGLPSVACVSPSAAMLARVAAALTDAERHALACQPLEPIYLSAPFVTVAKTG